MVVLLVYVSLHSLRLSLPLFSWKHYLQLYMFVPLHASFHSTDSRVAAYANDDYKTTPDRTTIPEPSKGPEIPETNTYDVDPVLTPPPPDPPEKKTCIIM